MGKPRYSGFDKRKEERAKNLAHLVDPKRVTRQVGVKKHRSQPRFRSGK